MDLTTQARVKALMQLGGVKLGGELDSGIALLITSYSASVEKHLNRWTEKAARTETFDLDPYATRLWLPAFPVDTGEDFMVEHDDDELTEDDDYKLDATRGVLTLDRRFTPGAQIISVTYTAGMAEDTDAFVAAYPDVAQALDEQIVHFLQRRDSMGSTSVSIEGGSIAFQGAVDWLPHVKNKLEPHARRVYV